jgi:tryptophan halogenase
MIGQNLMPESWNPIADQLSEERLREFLAGLEKAHIEDVSRMADHGAFVAKFAPVLREVVSA